MRETSHEVLIKIIVDFNLRELSKKEKSKLFDGL